MGCLWSKGRMATVHVLLCLCKLTFKGLSGEVAPKTWAIPSASSALQTRADLRTGISLDPSNMLLWQQVPPFTWTPQPVILLSEYFYLYLPEWCRGLTLFLSFIFFQLQTCCWNCVTFLCNSPVQSPKKQKPTLSSHISLGRLQSMSHCSLEILWTPDCGVLECGSSLFHLFCGWCILKNISGVRAGTRVHSLRDVGSGALLSGCTTLFPSASSIYEVNCFLCSGKPSVRGWGR